MHPGADDMARVQVTAFTLLVVVDVFLQCALGREHFAGLRGFPLRQARLEPEPAVGEGDGAGQQALAQHFDGEVEDGARFGCGDDLTLQRSAESSNCRGQVLLGLGQVQGQRFKIAGGKARRAPGFLVLPVDFALQPADQHVANHLALFVGELWRACEADRIQLLQQARKAPGVPVVRRGRQE